MRIQATKKGWKLSKKFHITSRNLIEAQIETKNILNLIK